MSAAAALRHEYAAPQGKVFVDVASLHQEILEVGGVGLGLDNGR